MMNGVFIAYIDESGNTGRIASGGTLTYTLGCVTISAVDWPAAFDRFETFRNRLSTKFDIPPHAELKANYLIHGNSMFRSRKIAPQQRHLIYRAHMRMVDQWRMSAFGIVIDKRPRDIFGQECFDLAWETLLQRLERKSHYDEDVFAIWHDDGEAQAVQRWTRYARRYLTAGSKLGGSISVAMNRLVEDPVPCDSRVSYFIQLADLVAYAAFRRTIPPGNGANRVVCPERMWEQLGGGVNREVNKLSGGAPGIVVRKK
jgi:Protein of unknown function (DUF3800)